MAGLKLQDWKLTAEERWKRYLETNWEIWSRLTPGAAIKLKEQLWPRLLGQSNPIAQAHEAEYIYTPVSIAHFIDDDFYLGSILRGNIFDKIREDLIELFAGRYAEVLLAGSLGWGKTVMTTVGIAYDIYKVSCLKNPADAYGLIPNSNVAFINVSVDKKQATKVLFTGIGNLIRHSPYFKEKFPYNPNITTELRFPRGVGCYPVAASPQAILGEGVFSAAFDEMNFYAVVEKSKQHPEGGTYDQATEMYTKMSRRIKSRMNKRGMLPGHLWMVSSARYPNDFTERKAVEALTDRQIFVRQYSAWETKPRSDFMAETFRVEVGDITRRSRILDGNETDVKEERVLEVPMDFYKDFEKDPDEATRDFGGISVLSIRPFIGRRDMITKMMEAGTQLGLKHPYTAFTVTLQDEHEHLIVENLDWEYDKDGKRTKLRNGPYYAHIDLAKNNDAAGFAVSHIVGTKQVSLGFGREKKFEQRPIIRLDLVLQIVAPQKGEIRIAAVRELLYRLRDLGMQFQIVTYDSFASEESIQILKQEGFTADNLSVDKDPSAYQAVKEAIYDERLLCYEMPILRTELATVRRDDKKGTIDHPPHGSKDCSDAAAGAVWHAEQAFAGGTSGEWMEVRGISTYDRAKLDDNDTLWWKVNHGVPLTPDEIARIK